MYIGNERIRPGGGPAALAALLIIAQAGLWAQANVVRLSTSKKLTVRFLLNRNMPFVHAELLIYYSQENFSAMERAKANLTLYNLFDQGLNSPPTSVQRALNRLGNDAQIEQRPDFLRIAVNFLPDRMGQFAGFVNALFTYNSFTLDRFNLSKERYWELLIRDRNRLQELALQLAFGHFFCASASTPALLTADMLRRINLAQIRSFHRRTFRPDNALLVVKGGINPYISNGLLEKEIRAEWPESHPEPRPETVINSGHRLFLLNMPGSEAATLYFFDLVPSFGDADFMPVYLLNQILFGFPSGRLFRSNRPMLISRNYQFMNELYICRPLPINCQQVRVQYDDLEDFLALIDGEKRKLARAPIENDELLVALNSAMGQLEVASATFDHDVRMEIDRTISSQRENPIALPASLKQISLEQVNRTIEGNAAFRPRGNGGDRGVLVIVGNSAEVISHLHLQRPETLELNKN